MTLLTEKDVCACNRCGRIVAIRRTPFGEVYLWDPTHFERRWIRSLLTPLTVFRLGFPEKLGGPHAHQPSAPAARVDCGGEGWDFGGEKG